MNAAARHLEATRATRIADAPIELRIGAEVIDVWLDDDGIHFRQEGTSAGSVLPWGIAIAMSLVPGHLPRMPSVAV
jgi:hypothetical protein